jgi:hypothetical protein
MQDPFLREHNEIALVSGSQRFEPEILARIENFMRECEEKEWIKYDRPEVLDKTVHVQTHEDFFQNFIKDHFSYILFGRNGVEKLLFETIVLHQLTLPLREKYVTVHERRSHSVLLAMIRRKLTELFLDLHPDDVYSVLDIETVDGIRTHKWHDACYHALATVRTIRLISRIEDCWMFFPSVYEMYLPGIDLFVFTENEKYWCVQVRAVEDAKTVCLASRANEDPADMERKWPPSVFRGSVMLSRPYPNYTFLPCNIKQPAGTPPLLKTEIADLENFFCREEEKQESTEAA